MPDPIVRTAQDAEHLIAVLNAAVVGFVQMGQPLQGSGLVQLFAARAHQHRDALLRAELLADEAQRVAAANPAPPPSEAQ